MRPILKFVLLGSLIVTSWSCESDKRVPPKGYIPNTPKASEMLEAAYFWTPQNKISSSYWKEANYVEVQLSDLSKNKLYGNGFLNMTGTYSGLSGFNKGANPKVTVKAGYDNEYLYILVEWKDTTADASYMSWIWNGPVDIRKSDTANGWTSQRNQDNISIIFNDASANVSRAWKWSLAYTAPFDMALNLNVDSQGNIIDGEKPIARNSIDNNSRTGPSYEWNSIRQQINLPDGSTKILDPSYYLADNYKTPLIGDIKKGDEIFNSTADCKYCHGPNGNGVSEGTTDGGRLADVKTNKFTRKGLKDFIGSSAHEGSGGQYFGKIKTDSVKVENLISFLRGIAGVPGNILEIPQNEPDVKALSNLIVGGINKVNSHYQVLFRRKLVSDNNGDITFSPDKTYKVSIRLSDNDEINYVGATDIELIFKSNEL